MHVAENESEVLLGYASPAAEKRASLAGSESARQRHHAELCVLGSNQQTSSNLRWSYPLQQKRTQQLIAEARAYAERIVETIREPLLVLDTDVQYLLY